MPFLKQIGYKVNVFRHDKGNTINKSLNNDLSQSVIDVLQGRVMAIDNDLNIISANQSVIEFLSNLEEDIQKDLPHFNAKRLIGTNIDAFHRNPAHQREMIAAMKQPYETSIMIGGHVFNLRAVPLFTHDGKRNGTVMEWSDSLMADYSGQVEAINRSYAVIEFDLNGNILHANQIFLDLMGYKLDEVIGQHHKIFVDKKTVNSVDYNNFWASLNKGKYQSAIFKRYTKNGDGVWIQASYNPILDLNGKPFKIVKYALDITEDRIEKANANGQIEAINRTQAVIEFGMDGHIIRANSNFLDAMGYKLDEIVGKHHRMFVDEKEQGQEYQEFWNNLRKGHTDAKVFKRIGKNGREVWIQASYNPILDVEGNPFKVVKYATDVTGMIGVLHQTQSGMSSMVAAVEEVSVAISEISRNLCETNKVANLIGQNAEHANKSSDRLNNAASAMGSIIGLIEDIAEQTNLLALNATIEAARAGDAGKGFAVVANEVKNLAGETAAATERVAKEINAVQAASQEICSVIEDTSVNADKVNEYVASVSAAVEEQAAGAKEISACAQTVSGVTSDLAKQIMKNDTSRE